MSKYKELDTICPNCRRPVNSRMSFCLECGDLLDHRRQVVTSGGRRRRSSAMSDVIKSALLVMALALFGIFVITVYESIKSYQTDGANAIKKARAYILNGEDENAINLLSRAMDEDKTGKNHIEMLALLDQCLYERGLKLAQAGHYRDAVTSFARVSPGYQNKDEVDKLIAEYSDKALPLEFTQVTGAAQSGESTSVVPAIIPALAGHAMSRLDKAAIETVPQIKDKQTDKATTREGVVPLRSESIAPQAIPTAARTASQVGSPSTTQVAPALSTPASAAVAPAVAPDLARARRSEMPPAAGTIALPAAVSQGLGTKKDESQVGSIARYNELLARYFSKNSSDSRAGAEPPSYDEWVASGKSDF